MKFYLCLKCHEEEFDELLTTSPLKHPRCGGVVIGFQDPFDREAARASLVPRRKTGPFSCYEKAEPDEPMFVLLGRDPVAAFVVRYWAELRFLVGVNSEPEEQIQEALRVAVDMEAWARKRGKEEYVDKAEAWDAKERRWER